MADPSKIAGGLRKALEAASAAKKVPQAPSIIVPSKISELKKNGPEYKLEFHILSKTGILK